ncbi:MAG: GNAT family N-acetyltransferase [Planctomycetaceae bacterium]
MLTLTTKDAARNEAASPCAFPAIAATGLRTGPELLLDGRIWVEQLTVEEVANLYAEGWDDLARHAASPNVFYERWNMLAALRSLRDVEQPLLLVVRREGKKSNVEPALCGLFPMVPARRARLKTWRLWGHDYTFLQTPLVRAGHERDVIAAWLDYVATAPDAARLIDLPLIEGDGPVAQAISDVVNSRRGVTCELGRYSRACLPRLPDWEDYVSQILSSHHRRELRRQHRRLSEAGDLQLRQLESADELRDWIDGFLRLEASGWKGESETAFAANSDTAAYFHAITNAAFDRGQLRMLGLFLDGNPVALKVNLLAGSGAFAFKIAYDEQYAKMSPGMQLELETIRLMHEQDETAWMDSCATSTHFMINRLWSGRKSIQHLLISNSSRLGNLCLGMIPLARAVKRTLKSFHRPAQSTDSSPAATTV